MTGPESLCQAPLFSPARADAVATMATREYRVVPLIKGLATVQTAVFEAPCRRRYLTATRSGKYRAMRRAGNLEAASEQMARTAPTLRGYGLESDFSLM